MVANGNPVCAISPGMVTGNVASVGIDDCQAGEDAALHLPALGHEDFGFIAARETHWSAVLEPPRDHGSAGSVRSS